MGRTYFYSEIRRDQGNCTFCHIEPYRNNKNNRQKCAFRYALENLLRILTHNSGSIQNHLLSEFFKSKKAPYHYSKKLQMAYIKNLT